MPLINSNFWVLNVNNGNLDFPCCGPAQADLTGLNPILPEHETQLWVRFFLFCFVPLCVKNLLKSIYDNIPPPKKGFMFCDLGCGSTGVKAD